MQEAGGDFPCMSFMRRFLFFHVPAKGPEQGELPIFCAAMDRISVCNWKKAVFKYFYMSRFTIREICPKQRRHTVCKLSAVFWQKVLPSVYCLAALPALYGQRSRMWWQKLPMSSRTLRKLPEQDWQREKEWLLFQGSPY